MYVTIHSLTKHFTLTGFTNDRFLGEFEPLDQQLLADKNAVAGFVEGELVVLWLDVRTSDLAGLFQLVNASHVDFVVEVTDVSNDRAILHLAHVLSRDDALVSSCGHKDVHLVDGIFNGGDFSGMDILEGRTAITNKLEEISKGKAKVQYKFRDWLISRQRYWGTPIPIIYCDSCGIVAEKEEILDEEGNVI